MSKSLKKLIYRRWSGTYFINQVDTYENGLGGIGLSVPNNIIEGRGLWGDRFLNNLGRIWLLRGYAEVIIKI